MCLRHPVSPPLVRFRLTKSQQSFQEQVDTDQRNAEETLRVASSQLILPEKSKEHAVASGSAGGGGGGDDGGDGGSGETGGGGLPKNSSVNLSHTEGASLLQAAGGFWVRVHLCTYLTVWYGSSQVELFAPIVHSFTLVLFFVSSFFRQNASVERGARFSQLSPTRTTQCR